MGSHRCGRSYQLRLNPGFGTPKAQKPGCLVVEELILIEQEIELVELAPNQPLQYSRWCARCSSCKPPPETSPGGDERQGKNAPRGIWTQGFEGTSISAIQGMSVQARDGADEATLLAIAEVALAAWPARPPSRHPRSTKRRSGRTSRVGGE